MAFLTAYTDLIINSVEVVGLALAGGKLIADALQKKQLYGSLIST